MLSRELIEAQAAVELPARELLGRKRGRRDRIDQSCPAVNVVGAQVGTDGFPINDVDQTATTTCVALQNVGNVR